MCKNTSSAKDEKNIKFVLTFKKKKIPAVQTMDAHQEETQLAASREQRYTNDPKCDWKKQQSHSMKRASSGYIYRCCYTFVVHG